MCEITFIMNAPSLKIEKPNNLQVFGGKKTKEPKQNSQFSTKVTYAQREIRASPSKSTQIQLVNDIIELRKIRHSSKKQQTCAYSITIKKTSNIP